MIKVKCVNDSQSKHFLEFGKVYEVDETAYTDHYIINDRTWLKSRFEVIKDEEQMNHRQKMKELLPIIQAYCDGAEVEIWSMTRNEWQDHCVDSFCVHHQYRIKQTPDTIDWSHVHKDYKFMARNGYSNAILFTNKPRKTKFDDRSWTYTGSAIDANHFTSYKQGTVSWEDSLVERPEGV